MHYEIAATGMTWTLGEAMMLVSWWKPLLLLIPFMPWAWLVSAVFDKHAGKYHLPRPNWNLLHLCCGLVALALAIILPIEGIAAIFVSLAAITAVLAIDVAIFVMVTNRDERVPEAFRLKLDFSSLGKARADRAAAKRQGKVELVLRRPDKSVVAVPSIDAPEFPVRVAAESIILKAIDNRAAQIDIAPTGKDNQYAVTYLVDSLRTPPEAMPGADAIKVMDYWKGVAKLDLQDRRRRLVNDVTVERGDSKKKIRITSMGSQAGMRLSLLIEPETQVRRKPADLGLLEPQMDELRKLVEEEAGVVLLAAPPDAGRTTTLYTIVKMHDAYTKNVQVVETEPQDMLEGAKQNKWEQQADGPEFSTFVRSLLRRDPDVLGVADLVDANTAKEIAKADHERTRVYVSVRGESVLSVIQQWLKVVGDTEIASKCLYGVVAQKLLRKLCTNCKVAYQPSPDMVKRLGLPPDRVKQLFKRGGQVLIKNKPEICPLCQGTGYLGLEGIFEIFTIGPAERTLLAKGDLNAIKLEYKKRNLPTIQQSAIKKAIDGITSVEEVMRVTVEARPEAQPGQGGKTEAGATA